MDEGSAADPRRRKLRKGTHSCWGCKRRKIRCTFSTISDRCDGCRRRGTACVSQEIPETLAPSICPNGIDNPADGPADRADSRTDSRAGSRLDRIEAIVDVLAKKLDGNGPGYSPRPDTPLEETIQLPVLKDTDHVTGETLQDKATTYTTWFGHERAMEDEMPPTAVLPPSAAPSAAPAQTTASLISAQEAPPLPAPSAVSSEYEDKYSRLTAAWPPQTIIDALLTSLSVTRRTRGHLGVLVGPTSTVLAASIPPMGKRDLEDLVVVPPAGTHLAIIALKLLTIVLFMQNLDLGQPSDKTDKTAQELMQTAVQTADSLVASQECLAGSLEGVHCLVLIGIYHNNQGSLRRAWLAIRKAMGMAQLLEMNRGDGGGGGDASEGLPVLELSTGHLLPPRCLWYRIVFADRYLSLMLGLPQGTPGDQAVASSSYGRKQRAAIDATLAYPVFGNDTEESREASAHVAVARRQLWQIEYRHAIIVGRLLERNEAWRGMDGEEGEGGEEAEKRENESDLYMMDDDKEQRQGHISTEAIDWALQKASQSMPADWWLTPSPEEWQADDGIFSFLLTQRVVDQLFHYHLLAQLHLPYMLGGRDGRCPNSSDPHDSHAYSKITCINASREVLTRFLALRMTQCSVVSSCRSIDFFGLLAGMTLCLAHLCSHQVNKAQGPRRRDFLSHQRPSDRGMMSRVLASMEDRARSRPDDALIQKSVVLLRRVLAIEEAAAACVASSSSDTAKPLRVRVPHLGTIHLSKEGVIRVGRESDGDSGGGARERGSIPRSQPSQLPSLESSGLDQSPVHERNGPAREASVDALPYPTPTDSDDTLQGVNLAFFEHLFMNSPLDDFSLSDEAITSLPVLDLNTV